MTEITRRGLGRVAAGGALNLAAIGALGAAAVRFPAFAQGLCPGC